MTLEIKDIIAIEDLVNNIVDKKFEAFEEKMNKRFMDLQELILQLMDRFDKEFTIVTIAKIDEHDTNIKKLDTRGTKLELSSK